MEGGRKTRERTSTSEQTWWKNRRGMDLDVEDGKEIRAIDRWWTWTDGSITTTKRKTTYHRRDEDALTERDALTYLREVKERFKDKKHVYESFLRIMKDFKVGR